MLILANLMRLCMYNSYHQKKSVLKPTRVLGKLR